MRICLRGQAEVDDSNETAGATFCLCCSRSLTFRLSVKDIALIVSVPPFVFVFFIDVITNDDDAIGVVVDEWSASPSNANNGMASLLAKQQRKGRVSLSISGLNLVTDHILSLLFF
ncbi:hypothetical protein QYF36_013465 [Acer negundo]|nr:hypothetical protein QYF36_013465 [Acer negundo]